MACGQAWYAIPEWWAVVVAAIVAAAGFGVWIERRLRNRLDAMPIIRCKWHQSTKGFTCTFEVHNRLNEDLYITEARAAGDFAWHLYETDSGGSIAGSERHVAPSPRKLNWSVKPLSGDKFELSAMGNRRWIKIKLSSSHRTLRAVWITLEDK